MKKITLTLAVATLLTGSLSAKENLKVLYVGGNTDLYEAPAAQKDSLVQARTEAFKKLLEAHFTDVKALQGSEYTPDMSKQYDVTIFDGRPQALTPRVIERDENGNFTKYELATYLPKDYDCATVTIGSMGETIGQGLGIKNDWYCLCLDADAHSWDASHPIFNGPFKVKLNVSNKPTPEDAKHYTYYYDKPLPDSIPMWSVQTKGFKTSNNFAIGMVSRPWGYLDSPDCEVMSSGVCAKTIDAVAIGRHGNFLHWGFAASPDYMTPEGKEVFANAVAYIAKFKGTKPVARKFNERRATREYLKEVVYTASSDYYNERMKGNQEWYEQQLQRYDSLVAVQNAGGTLREFEKAMIAEGRPQQPKKQTLDEFLQRYGKNLYEQFGANEAAYKPYIDENRSYFYGADGSYVIYVDEDAKAWGIPNNDIRLLDKAVESLEKGVETDRAKRVLARYTMADFETPAQWREWLDTYRDKMFFTESGGWKFLINGDSSLPGNDYFKYRERVKEQAVATTGEETSHANPVLTSVAVDNGPFGEQCKLVVKFKIHPGYHIYANVSSEDPYIPTKIELTLPEGVTAGTWKKSATRPLNQSGTTIFEDEAEYSCDLIGNTLGEVKCDIRYQCCDSQVCMPPAKKTLSVKKI